MLSLLFIFFSMSTETLSTQHAYIYDHMDDNMISCNNQLVLIIEKADYFGPKSIMPNHWHLFMYSQSKSSDQTERVRRICEGKHECSLSDDGLPMEEKNTHQFMHVQYDCVIQSNIPEPTKDKYMDNDMTPDTGENKDKNKFGENEDRVNDRSDDRGNDGGYYMGNDMDNEDVDKDRYKENSKSETGSYHRPSTIIDIYPSLKSVSSGHYRTKTQRTNLDVDPDQEDMSSDNPYSYEDKHWPPWSQVKWKKEMDEEYERQDKEDEELEKMEEEMENELERKEEELEKKVEMEEKEWEGMERKEWIKIRQKEWEEVEEKLLELKEE